jgi:putative membrane protein
MHDPAVPSIPRARGTKHRAPGARHRLLITKREAPVASRGEVLAHGIARHTSGAPLDRIALMGAIVSRLGTPSSVLGTWRRAQQAAPLHHSALNTRYSVLAAAAFTVYSHAALGQVGVSPAPRDLWTAWSADPAVLLGLVLAAALYARGLRRYWQRVGSGRGIARWQAVAYTAGLGAVAVALVSPLDALSTALFAAHMAQHLVLVQVAAPLLVLGAPLVPGLWAFGPATRRAIGRWWRHAPGPRAVWRVVSQPLVVWVLFAGVLWGWHLPALYQAALVSAPIHAAEHASLLGAALLLWWTVLHPGRSGRLGYGAGVLYLFATGLHSGLLGAFLTFAPVPWYPSYAPTVAAWGLSPRDDQQLAGLLMWVPGGLLFVLAACGLLVAWLQATERAVRRREAAAATVGPSPRTPHAAR